MTRALLAVALSATLLGACGGSDGGDARADGQASVTTATVITSAGTTDAGATTSAADTTVALPGETFVDPDGTYTLRVSPDWTEQFAAAPAKGIEVWQVAPSVDGFAANVNVITQNTPGIDVEGYLAAGVTSIAPLTVISSEVVTLGNRRVGVVEYEGTPAGTTRALHFLGVVDVADDVAVLATLTATEDAFASLRSTVERYLLTLTRT